jgi:glycogen synthase
VVDKYWEEGLQIAFIANGAYQQVFRDIVNQHGIHNRVAICNFDEGLSHIGFAASDLLLMPSLFEPCGLPQMISCLYGTLPVVRNTGGLHDSIQHLDLKKETGNGFVFDDYDAGGLLWGMDQAMAFHRLPKTAHASQTKRIMREAEERFNHSVTAQAYIEIYQQMLNRPLVDEVFEKQAELL